MIKITCSYSHDCFVSIEEIENKPVIKLDFAITSYKVRANGWQEYKFPKKIILKDKLYLNEEILNEVVHVLDTFIREGSINNLYTKKTQRGFSYIELKDIKGNKISIRDSSSAMDYYLWFGCNNNKEDIFVEDKNKPYQFPSGDVLIEDRMHLNTSMANELKNAMVSQLRLFHMEKAIPMKPESSKLKVKI